MSIYSIKTKITSSDTDPSGFCRASTLLSRLQDAAVEHANVLGVSRAHMIEKFGVVWVLARLWFKLDRPLLSGEEPEIKTWHRGGGAMVYRDFDICVDGVRAGEAVSAWVFFDTENKTMRMLGRDELPGTVGEDTAKQVQLRKLRMPAEMSPVMERAVRYSDLDINGHMNNARYADLAADAIKLEERPGEFIQEFRISYLHECLPGETLSILSGERDGGLCIRGVAEDGKTAKFDISLNLSSAPVDRAASL